VIFHATGDPAHNTTAPGGALADSGWQWQGNWRGFAGTPVDSRWFLTAQHLNGAVGEDFWYAGRAYRATAVFPDPASDLALWRVCGEFPAFAPLYAASDEVGRECVLYGTGLGRGEPLTVTNQSGSEFLRGWRWAADTQRLRWGVNRIEEVQDYAGTADAVLRGTFDADGGSEEATLTGGDSGGGLFIQTDGGWKLAGVALGVEGPFRHASEGEDIAASVFDKGGLYLEEEDGWALTPFQPRPQPGAFFVTRVSARRAWIESTIAANPEPAAVPEVLAAAQVEGPYATVAASGDAASGTLRVALPGVPTYYRLLGCQETRLLGVLVDSATLVLRYEVQGRLPVPFGPAHRP
jgi:hypothetical protein